MTNLTDDEVDNIINGQWTPGQVAAFEQAHEGLGEFQESIINVANLMAETLAPILRSIQPDIKALYDLFWQSYLDAGAPYGETDDGMMRWYREIGEARRLHNRAERILQHHEMLVKFRSVAK